MKPSRLPRPTGPSRPLPVFTTTELARKRLRHLSGSSTGSSIAGTPVKLTRIDSLPPSPPPVFFTDNGPALPHHAPDFSRPAGVTAPPQGTSKKIPSKGKANGKTRRPDTKPSAAASAVPPHAAASAVPLHAAASAVPPHAAASAVPPQANVPPPAPQRLPRVKGKGENRAEGLSPGAAHHYTSSMPSTSAASLPSTSDAATPSTSTAAAASQDCQDNNLPADNDDGFVLVTRKKKGAKGRKTSGAEGPARSSGADGPARSSGADGPARSSGADGTARPSGNAPLTDPRPLPAPRTSLAPRQDLPQRPTPAPRRARPSVSVARPQPPASGFPAFRVPAQEGYGTSYDAVAALEERFPFLNMRNMIGKDESSVLVPLNQESFTALEAAAANPGEPVKLVKLDPKTELTKGVVMGYPLRMPVALLKRHPQIEEAVRCVSSRLQEETKQVIITVRGPLPPQIDLGNWGIFYTRPYTPEPLRCFKCQRFGHHQARCTRPPVCGICSARHPTQQCLDKFKAKAEVRHKCPNCGQGHHAWNPSCPIRVQRVNSGREKQVQWVKEQQQTALVPAPPGTFVWGSQRQASAEAPQTPPQQEDFPHLIEPAVVPQTVAATSPAHRPTTATTAAPTTPTPPPGYFSKEVVTTLCTTLCKTLTVAVFRATLTATGVTVDFAAIEDTCSKITEEIMSQMLEDPQGSTEGATTPTANSSTTTPLPMATN